MKVILPVVEGDGDMQAVPELIRRIAYEADIYDLKVLRPHLRGDLPKVSKRFEDYLAAALLEDAPILWVLDYDCETCTEVERDIKALRTRLAGVHAKHPVEFAFVVKEFESLFLADHETTCEFFGDIPSTVVWPADPERVRDAKGFISVSRPKGMAYKETTHQAKLAAQVNIARLRERSPSFVRFETAVLALLNPN